MIGESRTEIATGSPYRAFVGRELAAIMAEFTGVPVDDLYEPANDAVWSNLITADGRPLTIDLARLPQMPAWCRPASRTATAMTRPS